MEISWIRIYLLLGLLFHKALWEILKRRGGAAPKPNLSLKVKVLSSGKLAALLAIVVQTVAPPVLPISSNPFGLEIAGLIVYTLGLLAAVTARVQLGWNWSDIEKAHVRARHELVNWGLYRYVRHPIYAGDILLLLGLELALNSWFVLGGVAIAVYVRRRAITEEKDLRKNLPGYEHYCRRTTRFLPFVPV